MAVSNEFQSIWRRWGWLMPIFKFWTTAAFNLAKGGGGVRMVARGPIFRNFNVIVSDWVRVTTAFRSGPLFYLSEFRKTLGCISDRVRPNVGSIRAKFRQRGGLKIFPKGNPTSGLTWFLSFANFWHADPNPDPLTDQIKPPTACIRPRLPDPNLRQIIQLSQPVLTILKVVGVI